MSRLPGSSLRRVNIICGVVVLVVGLQAHSYEGPLHQKLTFLAAKQFSRCVAGTAVPRLTALQVRYVAKSNIRQAETNIFVRMFNWSYYDRGAQAERSMLWLIDTRFHKHFNDVVADLDDAGNTAERYRSLCRVVNYVQDVTSPARAVPVYTPRFWRLNLADRFDSFPLDEEAIEEALSNSCDYLHSASDNYIQILADAASNTLAAVQGPMTGMPVSWESFWKLNDDEHGFGEYGPAGNNFGRKSEFRCGEAERCVLLDNDPLYADFALHRHIAAVIGTMRALKVLQSQGLPVVAEE